MNRRMRVRTYGGVGGRKGNNPAYPITITLLSRDQSLLLMTIWPVAGSKLTVASSAIGTNASGIIV